MMMLSASFFIMLFSFYSAVSVYSVLLRENGHENLGYQGLAIMYMAFALGCFIAPSIAGKFKT